MLGLCKALQCHDARVSWSGGAVDAAFSVEERMDGMHMRVVVLLVTSGLVMKCVC